MDFSRRVVVDTAGAQWLQSPKAGVWRKPLAREEAERGHATSVVRYDPGASFSSHNHPGGEEILVLDGTFSDETGNFHAGTYFRNPIGYRHAPFSEAGCLLLVKLHQFQSESEPRTCIETHRVAWQTFDGGELLELYRYGDERVAMLRLHAGAPLAVQGHAGGEEFFLIRGELRDERGHYSAGSWIRNPPGSSHRLRTEQDTLLWLKTGHLRNV